MECGLQQVLLVRALVSTSLITAITLLQALHTAGLVFMASNGNSDIIVGMILLVWFIVSMMIILFLAVYNLYLRRLLKQKTNNRYKKVSTLNEFTESVCSYVIAESQLTTMRVGEVVQLHSMRG